MEGLLQSFWLWAVGLWIALFFPARKLIWVLSVRRAEAKGDIRLDDAQRHALKVRAGVTSALLCFVFSFFYVHYIFKAVP